MKNRIFNVLLVFTLVIVGIVCIPGVGVMADDTNNYEIGVWWVNDYTPGTPLNYRDDSAVGFYDRLVDAGWNGTYCLGDYSVYETHFKKIGEDNGNDDDYTDAMDIVYYAGHGWTGQEDSNAYCPYINTMHDNRYIEYFECEWGDVDLEWIMLDCCYVLDAASRYLWHGAMDGLHLICGVQGLVEEEDNGVYISDLLIDDGLLDWARTVKTSWFSGMDYNNGSGLVFAVMGENDACGDDYIWGQGTVCSDPVHDNISVTWTYTC